jgi:arsenate reductase-like glutaredoxin family protein
MTCEKAQEFLERNKVTAKTTVDARKVPIAREEALSLTQEVDEIYASKGTKLVHLKLKKERGESDKIAELIIGPTGNLRAPTMRCGRVLLVGFNEEAYKTVLKLALASGR